MAQLVFDKHASFCQDYMDEVYETVSTLFARGPTEEVMNHVGRLYEIRRKYAAWIAQGMCSSLEPFEKALKQIGMLDHWTKTLKGLEGEEYRQKRAEAIEEMFSKFNNVMKIKDEKTTVTDEGVAIEEVMARIRSIIGIEELSEMRSKIISISLDYLRNDNRK